MPININTGDFVLPGNENTVAGLSQINQNVLRNKQFEYEKEQQNNRNKFQTAILLQEEFQPAKLLTGQKEIDATINQKLADGMQQALAKAQQSGYDPLTTLSEARNIIAEPAALSAKTKAIKAANKQAVDAISKMYPDVDIVALQDLAERNAFLTKDAYGRDALKPVDQIDDSRNHIVDILQTSPEQVVKGMSGLSNNIYQNFKPSTISSDDTEGRYRGASQREKWKATVNAFQEPYTDKDGQVVGVRTKGEDVNLFGKQESVLPDKEFNMLMADANSRLAVIAETNKRLKKEGISVNPNSPEGVMYQRKVAKELVDGISKGSFEKIQKQMSAPIIINNSGGSQSSSMGNEFLKNTMSAINSGDEAQIQNAFSVLNRGGKYENVQAKKDGGDVVVSYRTPQGVDAEGSTVGGQTFSTRIKNDASLSDNLKGVYQRLTGSDAKFEKMEVPDAPKPKKKEIKRSDLSSKAAAAGYLVKEYEEALKKAGVNIID